MASLKTTLLFVALATLALSASAGKLTTARATTRRATTSKCIADKIPTKSIGEQLAQGWAVEELQPGKRTYLGTDGLYQFMFVTYCGGVVVVDAPPSLGGNILVAIASVTSYPITHVVYSHGHADHISGAGKLPANAIYIAHEETKKFLSDQTSPSRLAPFGTFTGGAAVPVPSVTFTTGTYSLKINGNEILQLREANDGHLPGNLFIWVPQSQVLMKVDTVFFGATPFKQLGMTQDFRPFLAAHDEILKFPFTKIVSGHWGKHGVRADVLLQKEYITDLRANAASAINTYSFMQAVTDSGYGNTNSPNYGNPATLLEVYFQNLQDICKNLTLQKWTEAKLLGVTTWAKDHCFTVLEGIRLE